MTLSLYWHVCHLWLGHGVVPIRLLAPLYIPESPAALSPTHISVTWSTHICGIWWTWHGIRLGFWYLFHAPHYVPNIMNYIIDFIITTHAGVGMMDMTSCFRSFQLSSIVVYPLFPTQHYFQNMFTCVIIVCITGHIGGFPPWHGVDSHLTINAGSDFDNTWTCLLRCGTPIRSDLMRELTGAIEFDIAVLWHASGPDTADSIRFNSCVRRDAADSIQFKSLSWPLWFDPVSAQSVAQRFDSMQFEHRDNDSR